MKINPVDEVLTQSVKWKRITNRYGIKSITTSFAGVYARITNNGSFLTRPCKFDVTISNVPFPPPEEMHLPVPDGFVFFTCTRTMREAKTIALHWAGAIGAGRSEDPRVKK